MAEEKKEVKIIKPGESESGAIVGSVSSSKLKIWKEWTDKKKKVVFFSCITLLVVVSIGYFITSIFIDTSKDKSFEEKALTIKDLENSNVELTRQTSNASVDNLTRELKAKIDKQIADKQNPIDAVNELAGVLSNTTSQNRQDQLTNFIEDFLADHEKTLWFVYEYNKPDQAQVNYWKAQLYAYLVYNYQNMAYYKFTDANGKPIDTTKQQLKYIDLYLALANDPASHPPIPQKDKEFIIGYVYKEADNFSALKSTLSGGRVPR